MEKEDRCISSETTLQTRIPLKSHSHLTDYSSWKRKLRENCYKRVREDRTRLLWKLRLPDSPSHDQTHKDLIKEAFRDIVSDELRKIKDSSLDESKSFSVSDTADDILWEYDGLHNAYSGDCEEILLELQGIFYEDLRTEADRGEVESLNDAWEDGEDEYLAHVLYEHMQLSEKQASEKIWCPICKQGQLHESISLIYCNLCELRLIKDNEVNLSLLRDRLAEAHTEHLDRGCRLKPSFSIETVFNLSALYITCSACSTFEIVI